MRDGGGITRSGGKKQNGCGAWGLAFLAAFLSAALAVAGEPEGKGSRTFTDEDLRRYERASPAQTLQEGRVKTLPKEEIPRRVVDPQKMKRFQVPYKPFEGSVRRIIIPVTVNGRVAAPMLLDTGAPGMHLSYELAEKLGIMSSSEAKVVVPLAIGGRTSMALLTIIDSVDVGGARDTFVPAQISAPLSKEFDGIIGLDFLGNYSMSVDTNRKVVIFEELPARAEKPGGHDEQWWRATFRDFAERRRAWERYREEVYEVKSDSEEIRTLRSVADRQVREAADLLGKLNRYASEFAVPMHWREN